ncbi:hypothetical protein H6758_00960 [Candidatus Nomurabacteria bacterium]|nr:hypothetical protein [Candidatus Nomurabacteria bacterium]
MRFKIITFLLLTLTLLSGCSAQNEQNTYQSENYSFEFQYQDDWYVKETEQRIMVSPDPNFDSSNEMIGENAPVEIHISNQSVIDDIIQNYNSTPEKTYVADRKAQQISYEGLGQTFTVISIEDGNKFVEIWKNQITDEANAAFRLIYSTLKF